ncbi:MAG: hypothetical protein Unbinned1446contig1004_7 [Prokaryotic dsDNA virus sp.]|nr:MAG: hypothetical protein Unbinned1446contig1004_7 [Prokaryotic dsDNA virus sp.]|tara:strand:+ start:13000 stop:13368 length:369 start_codon:yes stop_codon:yes gene_type:complete
MIKPSLKTKERLAKRLSRHGVHTGTVDGELYFMEPARIKISSSYGISFVVKTELPIAKFEGDSHFTFPVAGRVSRIARYYHRKKLIDAAMHEQREAKWRANESAEELVEFLNHIKNPRVVVR